MVWKKQHVVISKVASKKVKEKRRKRMNKYKKVLDQFSVVRASDETRTPVTTMR